MRARIYQPSKTAMSSGTAKTRGWALEHTAASSDDTQSQVKLRFDTKEAALSYAEANGIDAVVREPNKRKANIRSGGYAENFATNRRGAWTH